MSEQDIIRCERCQKEVDSVEELTSGISEDLDGLCEKCYELDPTPHSEGCDNCDNKAVVSIGSGNYCEDCHDDMIGGIE